MTRSWTEHAGQDKWHKVYLCRDDDSSILARIESFGGDMFYAWMKTANGLERQGVLSAVDLDTAKASVEKSIHTPIQTGFVEQPGDEYIGRGELLPDFDPRNFP